MIISIDRYDIMGNNSLILSDGYENKIAFADQITLTIGSLGGILDFIAMWRHDALETLVCRPVWQENESRTIR